MSNVETYREKALKCEHAADRASSTGERAELFGLASIYMALADYVDRTHEHGAAHRGGQDQEMQRSS